MISEFQHIRRRRKDLRSNIDVVARFEEWEESCVPSYCHPNLLAAYVSWLRLFRAAGLAKHLCPANPRILDFGSSVGELGHLVSDDGKRYDFIEADDHSAAFLSKRLPFAKRTTLEEAPSAAYDLIFAIDSLEHNDNYAELLAVLVSKMSPDGLLILSGPTENFLYRLGRRLAGFSGHYHETTIYKIEEAASQLLRRTTVRSVLPLLPLFRISAWRALP